MGGKKGAERASFVFGIRSPFDGIPSCIGRRRWTALEVRRVLPFVVVVVRGHSVVVGVCCPSPTVVFLRCLTYGHLSIVGCLLPSRCFVVC